MEWLKSKKVINAQEIHYNSIPNRITTCSDFSQKELAILSSITHDYQKEDSIKNMTLCSSSMNLIVNIRKLRKEIDIHNDALMNVKNMIQLADDKQKCVLPTYNKTYMDENHI